MKEAWIRRLQPEDLDAVASLNTEVFGSPEEAAIVRRLHADNDSLLSMVVHRQGQLIGHIEFFRILIDGQPSAVGLGPMCLKQEAQDRGIGSALVRMGLTVMTGRGESIVFVLGHPEFYTRIGFSAEAAAPFRAPWSGPAFMAQVINPGAPAGGELTYPAAFG